jgi:hypothetical protein
MMWDLFMVYLAFVNLGLIVFDLSYLWLRPLYFRHMPTLTRIYDPVKGIGPHPLTDSYLDAAQTLDDLVRAGAPPADLEMPLAELRQLSRWLIDENPFERSGQTRSLIRLAVGVGNYLQQESGGSLDGVESPEQAFDYFWSLQPEPEHLPLRLAYFNRDLQPLLAVNYYRSYDLDGDLTDNFLLLDLPFLTIFALEFGVRWLLAARRSTYGKWFLFPIFNWYDVLGLVPVKQLRVFRLFRIASIYVRLHRSELTSVGDDIISRTGRYFANIISEEISDMVALRILNETQEEIRDGTHQRIIRTVAEAHRDALATQLAGQVSALMNSEPVREQALSFLETNLEQAVESAEALRRLPLPDVVLRPLVATVGQAVFNAFADTLAATLASEEGQAAVAGMIADAVDGLVDEITEGEMEEVVREISLDAIKHIKETVSVRKWALPDQPPRRILTKNPRV